MTRIDSDDGEFVIGMAILGMFIASMVAIGFIWDWLA